MSHPVARGKFVRGEVTSANASAGVTATLYNAEKVAQTLGPTERLVIYDVVIVAAATGNIALCVNADTGGQRLIKGTVAANGGVAIAFQRPIECPVGVVPKLFAPAGQADLSFNAEIIKG